MITRIASTDGGLLLELSNFSSDTIYLKVLPVSSGSKTTTEDDKHFSMLRVDSKELLEAVKAHHSLAVRK